MGFAGSSFLEVNHFAFDENSRPDWPELHILGNHGHIWTIIACFNVCLELWLTPFYPHSAEFKRATLTFMALQNQDFVDIGHENSTSVFNIGPGLIERAPGW